MDIAKGFSHLSYSGYFRHSAEGVTFRINPFVYNTANLFGVGGRFGICNATQLFDPILALWESDLCSTSPKNFQLSHFKVLSHEINLR